VSVTESAALLAGDGGDGSIVLREVRLENEDLVLGAPVMIEASEGVHSPDAIAMGDGAWLVGAGGCSGPDCRGGSQRFYVFEGGKVRSIAHASEGPAQLSWIGRVGADRFVAQLVSLDASSCEIGSHDAQSLQVQFVVVDTSAGTAQRVDWMPEALETPAIHTEGSDALAVPLYCAAESYLDEVTVASDTTESRRRITLGADGSSTVTDPQVVTLPGPGSVRWTSCSDDGTTMLLTRDDASAMIHQIAPDGSTTLGPSTPLDGEIKGERFEPTTAAIRVGSRLDLDDLRKTVEEQGITPDEYLARRGSQHVVAFAAGRWHTHEVPAGTSITVTDDGRMGVLDHGQTFAAEVFDD
jgi:hypothetical protein